MATAKENGIHDNAMEFNDNSAGMLAAGKENYKNMLQQYINIKYINMTILNLQELMCLKKL